MPPVESSSLRKPMIMTAMSYPARVVRISANIFPLDSLKNCSSERDTIKGFVISSGAITPMETVFSGIIFEKRIYIGTNINAPISVYNITRLVYTIFRGINEDIVNVRNVSNVINIDRIMAFSSVSAYNTAGETASPQASSGFFRRKFAAGENL